MYQAAIIHTVFLYKVQLTNRWYCVSLQHLSCRYRARLSGILQAAEESSAEVEHPSVLQPRRQAESWELYLQLFQQLTQRFPKEGTVWREALTYTYSGSYLGIHMQHPVKFILCTPLHCTLCGTRRLTNLWHAMHCSEYFMYICM